MTERYTVRNMMCSIPVKEYVADFVDVEKFIGYCRECPNCGKLWSCPPFAFDPLEMWSRYETLRLYVRVLTPEKGADLPALLAGMNIEKDRLFDELMLLEKENSGSAALAAGSCTLCPECTRPAGQPCRHPGRLRYSIEALGGDVVKTMEQCFHLPLQWSSAGSVPAYMTLVGGLLLRGS